MARTSKDRVALLVALIPYLVAEGSVTVAEAAAHFDVAPERIREAVGLIFMSGVPDGFGDFDRFDLNYDAFEQDDVIELSHLPALDGSTIRLAPREAGAILAGLTLLAGVHGADQGSIDALMARLRAAAVPAPVSFAVDAPQADDAARVVRDAIEHGVVVELDYRKPGSPVETRHVAPTALELRDGAAFVRGLDLDRDAVRRFRLDRTESVRRSDLPYPERARDDEEPRGRLAPDQTIVVSATPAAATLLADYAVGRPTADPEHAERERLEIQVWNADAVLRQVASLGGDAWIVAPASARAAMRRFAEQALAAYPSADRRHD